MCECACIRMLAVTSSFSLVTMTHTEKTVRIPKKTCGKGCQTETAAGNASSSPSPSSFPKPQDEAAAICLGIGVQT